MGGNPWIWLTRPDRSASGHHLLQDAGRLKRRNRKTNQERNLVTGNMPLLASF
jgi:hypothetical protein